MISVCHEMNIEIIMVILRIYFSHVMWEWARLSPCLVTIVCLESSSLQCHSGQVSHKVMYSSSKP